MYLDLKHLYSHWWDTKFILLFSEKKKNGAMTEIELPFRSEYAKSGRSSCKACKTSIEKAQLRLAAMVQVIKY